MESTPLPNIMDIPAEYRSYQENPEKIFEIAKKLSKESKDEDAISALEQAIKLAILKYGSENAVELSIFYKKYADSIIKKLLANDEIINMNDEDENNASKNTKNKEEAMAGKDEQSELEDDEQIAFANLVAAQTNLNEFLEKYKEKKPSELDDKVKKYFFELADVFNSMADLEKINSKFHIAADYLKKSIEIYKKYGDPFSRDLAGLHFELSQTLENDPNGCLLNLYKSKVIMEHFLQEEMKNILSTSVKMDELALKVDEKDLDLEKLEYNDERIFRNKDIVSSEEMTKLFKDNPEVEEFAMIIRDIYPKLEDVTLEIKQFDAYMKTKEAMKNQAEGNNTFKKDYDGAKIVDLMTTTLIKKKRKEPDDEDIKKLNEGDKKVKKT